MNDLKGVNSNKWPSVSKCYININEEFPTEEASFKKARGDKEIQKKIKNGLIWLIMLTILVAEYTLF
jgi:hypothetical protein